MKNTILYNKNALESCTKGLGKYWFDYEYHKNQSLHSHRQIIKDSNLLKLTPFNYEGVDFNMISFQFNNMSYDERLLGFELCMLGECEVTQDLFETVMGFNYSVVIGPKNPIEMVTWYDCIEFCNRLSVYFGLGECYKLRDKEFTDPTYCLSIGKAYFEYIPNRSGFRLPTATEWMIAAMAGTNNKYAGANDDDALYDVAWFQYNCDYPQPVAQKLPNEWGFYDMSGNVYEWVDSKLYPNQESPDAARLFFGGSYGNNDSRMDLMIQNANPPYIRNNGIGFRIAISM